MCYICNLRKYCSLLQKILRQRDGLTPVFFNIALREIITGMKTETMGTIITKEASLIAYVDDLNITGGLVRTQKLIYKTYVV